MAGDSVSQGTGAVPWDQFLQGAVLTTLNAGAGYLQARGAQSAARQEAARTEQPMPLSNTGYEWPAGAAAQGYVPGVADWIAENKGALLLGFGSLLAIGLVLYAVKR